MGRERRRKKNKRKEDRKATIERERQWDQKWTKNDRRRRQNGDIKRKNEIQKSTLPTFPLRRHPRKKIKFYSIPKEKFDQNF